MNPNWKEVQFICEALNPVLSGLKIDQVIIPERNWGEGFLKNEWALRVAGLDRFGTLVFGLRPYFSYFIWTQKQSPKSQALATRSPFDLALSRYLPGSIIQKFEAYKKERIFALWFTHNKKPMGLVFSFLPKRSEIFLVEREKETEKLAILSSSWLSKDSTKKKEYYNIPAQANPPVDIEIRNSLKEGLENYYEETNQAIEAEEFKSALADIFKSIESKIKNIEKKLKTLATTLDHIEKSQPWQRYGDVLKSHLGILPKKITEKTVELQDYASGETISVPFNSKTPPSKQVENFYENARKQKGTQMEALLQRSESRNLLSQLQSITLPDPSSLDWNKLQEIQNTFSKKQSSNDSKTKSGPGKKVFSTDGSIIHVGRNKKENLEITFKFARGNDLWMHVKGKPSSHAIILLPSGKTASLETLLDAATLILHYSKAADWGKTEMDYTYRKYVKRIKNSDEVSYTQNKTLMTDLDSDRLNRLLNPGLK